MKNSRKILSIILTICMVMQILPVFAAEGENIAPAPGGAGGSGINYLINDDFSAPTDSDNGLDGWSLATDTGFTDYPSDIVTTEEIKDTEGNGTGNYALKYSVTSNNWDQTHIEKAVTRADGSAVTFETGTDVVIETRMAQSTGNTYAEDGTLTTAGSGRSYLKYNLPADADTAEWNLNFGTLVRADNNDDGSAAVRGFAGWSSSQKTGTNKNGEEVSWWYADSSKVDLATVVANEYFNVKVVIHGQTGGVGNTADYYILDDNGNVIKESKNNNIDHPGERTWGLNDANAIYTTNPATWVEDVLNTIDFRMRNANTLYVDYVRVYEVTQESVQANLVNGRYVQFDENIEVKLTTEAEKITLIEETAKLTTAAGDEVAASVSYDAESKILSIDPAGDLTPGDIYNLTFTANDFNTFTGTAAFELEARAARSYGVVVNDTFDDLALGDTDNASGWYLGEVTGTTEKGTLTIVDSTTDEAAEGATGKALKFSGDYADVNNNQYSYLTRKIGGGIEYKDGGKIVLKTRIKHTTNTARVYFVENMPATLNVAAGALGNNLYNIFTIDKTSGIQPYSGVNSSGTGNMQNASNFATGDFANKWLDVEVTIDGYNKLMTSKVSVADDTNSPYTAADKNMQRNTTVLENHYGKGTTETAFDALERLGFFFREADNVLYIDEFKVYEVYDNVKVSAGETYKPGEAIDVKFDVPHGDDAFLDAVKLYNGDAEIEAVSKSINEANNIVTITPDEALTEGAYKVKIDTTNIPAEVYNIKNTTAAFYVTDKEYLIYDEFGKDDTEGWEHIDTSSNGANGNSFGVSTVDGDSGNYMMTYSGSSTAGYITKSLPSPSEFGAEKNVVIETRVKQGTTGRTYLKYNLGATDTAYSVAGSYTECEKLWGNLVMNQKGSISLHNSYTQSSGDYYYPAGFGGTGEKDDNANVVTEAANNWYTYKVVIHGGTAGENHTATGNTADYYIYDATGNELARRTGFDIDFPDNSTWINGDKDINWLEDALYSVDFRLREDATLEIDYVKVWEYTSSDVRVNTVGGKTFEAGKAIEFKVTAADGATVSNEIVNTVTVEKDGSAVNAAAVYENGILKVTPAEGTVAEGDTVTVTFADNDYVKYVDSTTEFTLTARGERETGVIINDDFTDGTDGWVQGASNITTTVERDTTTFDGKSVLKITTTDENAKNSAGYQPTAFKALGNGVEIAEGKKIVIKTGVYVPESATGRFDLKFNRPNSATQVTGTNDYVWLGYGLLRNDSTGTPSAAVPKSIYPSTHEQAYFVADNKLADAEGNVLNPEGKWVDYTFEIGDDETMFVTAVADGTEYTANGIFKLQYPAYADIYGANVAEADARVKALESLTFKNTVPKEPVYIDYITVYDDSAIVKADVTESVRYDKPIKIKLETAGEIAELDGAAAITGIEADYAYDADTKTITLTPEADLTIGESVMVTLDKAKLEALGFIYEGEESFTVKVRDNYIINDDFTNGLGSWRAGATAADASAYSYGVTDDGLMYLTVNDSDKSLDILGAPNLINDFADVDYEEGTNIVIKAKYKHMGSGANDRAYIKFNRPDITSFSGNEHGSNWYMLTGMHGTKYVVPGTDASAPKQVYPESGDGNMADKWVESTVEIDYANKKTYTTLVIDGQTYGPFESELENSAAQLADAGAPETGFTSLNSLTFILRQANGNTKGNSLYVDYVQVYEKSSATVTIDAAAMPGYDVKIKGNADIGAYITTGDVILENLETYVDLYKGEDVVNATKTHIEGTNKVVINPTNDLEAGTYTVKFDTNALAAAGYEIDGKSEFDVEVIEGADVDLSFENAEVGTFADSTWAFEDSTLTQSAEIVEENGSKFLRITANGPTAAKVGEVLTYSKTLETPFVRDMKASTVFEAKVRTNSDAMRKQIKYNYPNEGSTNTNVYPDAGLNTRIAAVMNNGNLGVAYDDYRPDDQRQGKVTNVAEYETDKWYTIKTIYHNSEGTASTYVYDDTGVLIGELEDKALTAWWFNSYEYTETQPQVMHSIDDITIRFRPNANGTVTDEQFDIDYIKLYNITVVEESATAKFMDGEEEVKAITKDGSVTPTFEIQSKNNAATDYYIIAAVYNDGRLASAQMKEVTVTGKQTVTLDAIEVDKDNTGLVVKAFVWSKNMVPVCGAAEIKPTVYAIYMAADGNDANEGYESTPVATLNRAIELANDAKTKGYATSEVIVADGNYELTGNTISIGSNLKADSLTVKAANKGEAKFINGISFKVSEAVKVEDTAITGRLTSDTAKANLYMIDLGAKLGGIDKIPAVNLPGTYSYTADGLAMASGTFNIEETKVAPGELFIDGTPMTVARYPDGEYAKLGTVSIDGVPADADCNYTSVSVTREWMSDKNTVAVADRKADPFTVKLAQAANWTSADQALAFGYWGYDWATQTVPVTFANGVMTSKYPSHYGLKEGQRYYVFNLLEEISQPNEYFIDRKTGIMYFYKPEGLTGNEEIAMSLYSGNIFDITASNVTIDGLVITASRGKAVRASGNNIKIQNCEISDTADMAVSLSGTNSVISDCYIHDVNGGISLGGGSTHKLVEGNNKALRNKITNFSRINKTYTDAISVSGMGNTASYNTIWNGEHLAMRILGVGNEISYNNISQVLKETDDAGAIYGGRSWISRDNVIKNNYFHDMGTTIDTTASGKNPVAGIFLDDHFADVEITGNVFENIGGHGVRTNMGREITISNNIFEGCTNGGFSVKKQTQDEDYFKTSGHISGVENIIAGNDGYDFAKWKEEYPELFNAEGTAYNPDLIKTQKMVLENNYISGSDSGYSTGDITFGDSDGNIDSGNEYASASKTLNGDFSAANQQSIVQKAIENFVIIDFAAIAANPAE